MQYPKECPVFESRYNPGYFTVGVGVWPGVIEVAYPCTPTYPTTNLLDLRFFGKGNDYQAANYAARQMLSIARGAR